MGLELVTPGFEIRYLTTELHVRGNMFVDLELGVSFK